MTARARRPRVVVPAWVAVLVGAASVAIGLYAGPTMPWADGSPATDSAEAGFARDMVVHHDQAVAMSLIAMRRGSDPAVRSLATDVVLTQRGQSGAMLGWLDQWGLSFSDSSQRRMAWMGPDHLLPDGRMPGMATTAEVQGLEALTGTAFDRAYLSMLYTHHAGGIPMAAEVLERTDEPVVVAMATSIRASQTAELEVLTDLLAKAGGTTPAVAPHGDGH